MPTSYWLLFLLLAAVIVVVISVRARRRSADRRGFPLDPPDRPAD
jgi:hypothetical protein